MFKPLKVPCLQTLDELKAECKRLGLRMILPDHMKTDKHKRNREEEAAAEPPKTKRFKIELEKLVENDLHVQTIKSASQENDRSENGLTRIGLFQHDGMIQLSTKTYSNLHRNKLQTSKLTNGIVFENGKLDRNGVWHNNGRLRNVQLDYGKLCNGLSVEENGRKLADQIVIIERLKKPQILEPEIIEIDVEPVLYDDEPPEEFLRPEIVKKTRQSFVRIETVEQPSESSTETETVKKPESSTKAEITKKPPESRVNKFYVKETAEQINLVVRSLSNFAAVEKRFNFLIELKRYSDDLNAQLVKHNNKPISIQNDVDEEMPPKFTYTNEYDLSVLDKATLSQIEENVQKCKMPV